MCIQHFVGNPEGKGPFWRLQRTIKINLMGIGFEGVDWIRVAQVRIQWLALVNIVMKLRSIIHGI